MSELERLAREVVAKWESGNLAEAVNGLRCQLEEIDKNRTDHEMTIEAARSNYASDDIEVDDVPTVSIGDGGVWVSAWVWVPIEAEAQKLQWLILPDENSERYTNWGDGREGDATELVRKVNADSALNQGYTDWRLPSIDELKSLIGTAQAPKKGWYWSSSPYVGVAHYAWVVNFGYGDVDANYRYDYDAVRLVRASQ